MQGASARRLDLGSVRGRIHRFDAEKPRARAFPGILHQAADSEPAFPGHSAVFFDFSGSKGGFSGRLFVHTSFTRPI